MSSHPILRIVGDPKLLKGQAIKDNLLESFEPIDISLKALIIDSFSHT